VNLDVGEVLRRAWQITWQHRALWIFGALPRIPALFVLPAVGYVFLSADSTSEITSLLNDPLFLLKLLIVMLLMAGISFFLQVFSTAATTSGIVRIEAGSQPAFDELFRGGQTFFGRILGAMLLGSLGTIVLLAVFSACLSLVGFVTFGLGAVLGQLVFLPVTLLIHALLEQAQAAIVADGLRPTGAFPRAWKLVREHLNLFAVLALVLYFGLSVFGSLAMAPVMLPVLLAVLGRFSGELVSPTWIPAALLCFVAILPMYLAFQAGALVYMKSAFVVTYLRLTRSPVLQPLPEIGEATL
jgi:hypothetical protein